MITKAKIFLALIATCSALVAAYFIQQHSNSQPLNIDNIPVYLKPYPSIKISGNLDTIDKAERNAVYEVEGDYTDWTINNNEKVGSIKRGRYLSVGSLYDSRLFDEVPLVLESKASDNQQLAQHDIVRAKVRLEVTGFKLEDLKTIFNVNEFKNSIHKVSTLLPSIDKLVRNEFADYLSNDPDTSLGLNERFNTCNSDRVCIDGIMLGQDTFWDSERKKLLIWNRWYETGIPCGQSYNVVTGIVQADVAKSAIEAIYLDKTNDKAGCPIE